jgi:hypothetical protein
VFRFLSWLRRRSNPGAQAAPFAQQVTVQLADGQLANGRVVERRSDGDGDADGGPYHPTIVMVGQPAGPGPQYPRRRWHRFIPRWAQVAIVIAIVLLFFRRIAAWAVLAALSAALHLFGANVNLPHVSFGWPWSSTTTTTLVGPIVLQKIEGIDKPALGTANFDFVFTHKVTKNIGFLPCWYSATFAAVGRASATVDLNPGTAWWKSSTGHYQLRVLSQPAGSIPGKLAITMALPLPQLPQSVHDVSIDNTLSSPISTSHSWTYPGLACGALIQPQFAQSVLYAQAQTEAYSQATTLPSVTKPLIAAAEKEATTIIRDNFIAPTAGALHYNVAAFSIRWVPPAR